MAEIVMGPLVGRLQELAMNEAQAMVAVNYDVRSLGDRLMRMRAFVRDADPWRRAMNYELAKVCLQQTRDAIFDAEDALDQYFLQVDLSRYPSWSRAILKFFTGFTTQVRLRRDLSRRIKSINNRLECIIEDKNKYKINDAGDMSITTWRPSTAIFATAEKLDGFAALVPLAGRVDKLKNLENALMEREIERPVVISVIGRSGVGKTKLVEEIYEKCQTKNHFDVRVWANIAPNLSASNIQKLIFMRLSEGSVPCPKGEAGQKLREELKDHKYLLVIDGEVCSTVWNNITNFLPTNRAESRVVRITKMTKPEPPHSRFKHIKIELQNFEEKDTTTQLFRETIFMDKESEKHSDDVVDWEGIDKHNQDIFDVTGGLPLAVVLLSGLLRTKEYPGEWNKVFEHLKGKSNDWKRLDSILSMCFDDLPHDLKSCFLYFAAFPVNTLFKARTLVCMWMAEGFLRPKAGKTMEQVGECYLNELVRRCLIELPPLEYAAPGDQRVTVPNKVHDFLLLEAQEANFVEVHSGDDFPALSTARRLSLQNQRDKYIALTDPLPKLRSILSNFEKEESNEGADETKEGRCLACLHPRKGDSKDFIKKLLQGSEFLRVILLDGLEIGNKLPSEIGNVVHLQYLGITSCCLKEIPPSIGKLTRLQTLDVRSTYVSELPREFWMIRTLRHVFGSLFFPKRVRHLEQLQTLTAIKPHKADDWDIKTLANMKRLQSLYISGLSEQNVQALSVVRKLKYLVLLIIRGKSLDLFTGSNLPRLQVMHLRGEIVYSDGNHAPSSQPERGYLPNLKTLFLKETKVSQDFIDMLGKLPCLATLALFKDSYNYMHEKGRLSFTCGFRSLKELTLDVYLETIVIKELVFPDIENLEILCYSTELCVKIHNRPSIKEKIKSEGNVRFPDMDNEAPEEFP